MKSYQLSIIACLLASVAGACGEDTVGSAPVSHGGGAGSSGAAGAGGNAGGSAGAAGNAGAAGAAGAAPVVRSIIVRDVFEAFDTPDNLMLDGGFEMSGETSTTWGGRSMSYGNGAVCRSGVRCGIASPQFAIVGLFVSPPQGQVQISLRTRNDGVPCDAVTMVVYDVYSNAAEKWVGVISAETQADGWCLVEATAPSLPYATAGLYIEPLEGRLIVDDVVAVPAGSNRGWPDEASQPLSAALRLRVGESRVHMMDRLRGKPGARRSPRTGTPWTTVLDPWVP